MKRIKVRRKSRRGRMAVFFLFFFSLFCFYIVKPIFIQVQQTYYSVQIQKYERSITSLRQQNEALNIDIQQLSQYSRIVAIARENGYERTHTNIITIGRQD